MAADLMQASLEMDRLRLLAEAADVLQGSLEQAAKTIDRLTREKANLHRELDHERKHGQQQARQCNAFEHELRRVQQILLQEGVTPDQLEQEGTDVMLVQVLDHAQRAVAR